MFPTKEIPVSAQVQIKCVKTQIRVKSDVSQLTWHHSPRQQEVICQVKVSSELGANSITGLGKSGHKMEE